MSRKEGLALRTAHYQLMIDRVRIDECKALLWEGVEIEMDLEKDLGLKGAYTISVSNPVLSNLLAATLKAIGLELEATRMKLIAAEEGSKENVERFKQKIRDLMVGQARVTGLGSERYPVPVIESPDPASGLESSGGFGPVLPPRIREVTVMLDGPCAEGDLLPVEGTSKSGPFYHLAGIAGGDYRLLKPGKKFRLRLCLVYRREYFGLIDDFYVYVLGVR